MDDLLDKLQRRAYGCLFRAFHFTGILFPVGATFLCVFAGIKGAAAGFVIIISSVVGGLVFFYNIKKTAKNQKIKQKVEKVLDTMSPERKRETRPHQEVQSAEPKGFIFGTAGRKFVVKDSGSPGHIVVIGGTGSGKSSGIAIPSTMCWDKRILALDIKGELYEKAGHRRANAIVFNPADKNTVRYDPYYMMYDKEKRVQSAREIALTIIPPNPHIRDPFWLHGAQNLLTGAILLYQQEGFSFIETIQALSRIKNQDLLDKLEATEDDSVRFFVYQFLDLEMKTFAGIRSQLNNSLTTFATDPDIARAFTPQDGKAPLTPDALEQGYDVFFTLSEDKIDQHDIPTRLFINQHIKHLYRRKSKVPILLLLDEFPRLGPVYDILNAVATLRDRNVTFAFIVQSFPQLDRHYGADGRKIIIDNCRFKAILDASDPDTTKALSDMIGTTEYLRITESQSFDPYTKEPYGKSESETEIEKRIEKPEDLSKLDEEVILLTNQGYSRFKQARYYKTPAFMDN